MRLLSARYLLMLLITALLQMNIRAEESGMDYSIYNQLLKKYVTDQGFVDYKGLKQDNLLAQSLEIMKNVSDVDYVQWNEKEQIAFWCNAYNLFTLKAIADHYPIKAGWLSSLTYPKNSIRQISGVWDQLTFETLGKKYTLSQIEHEILRVKFNEPRIHFAIVCASIGCPVLRNEAYTGRQLEEQLEDQTKRFLSHPQNFRIDKEKSNVYLSSILSWFGEDFTRSFSTETKYNHLSSNERAVINFISQYASDAIKQDFETGKFSISYNSYDWTLNEKP